MLLLIVQFDDKLFRGHWIRMMKGPRTHDVTWEGGMELSTSSATKVRGRVKHSIVQHQLGFSVERLVLRSLRLSQPLAQVPARSE